MDASNALMALGLTLFAGLCTGIGSALAFFTRRTNTRFLSISLGFSAGVMIYISMTEIMFKAREALVPVYGSRGGMMLTVLSFFGGMLLIALIDKLVPGFENPHEPHMIEELCQDSCSDKDKRLLRMGLFSAIAIAIHNFPEGLATFTAALKDPKIGVSIAIAVAIHNIPEGIAVSVPVYHATGSRKRAFIMSFLSGLSEPAGALIGFFVLLRFFNDAIYGVLFAAVARIMVFISLDELLPASREYGEHHLSMYGIVGGMIVMAASLVLFS